MAVLRLAVVLRPARLSPIVMRHKEAKMRQLFDRAIIEKAIAPPSEIERAKEHGHPFDYCDTSENVRIAGYWFNGIYYVTSITQQ